MIAAPARRAMATTSGKRAASLADTGAFDPGWGAVVLSRGRVFLHAKSCERFVSGAKCAPGGTRHAQAPSRGRQRGLRARRLLVPGARDGRRRGGGLPRAA